LFTASGSKQAITFDNERLRVTNMPLLYNINKVFFQNDKINISMGRIKANKHFFITFSSHLM
jgi:hypothetical protein